MVLVAVTLAACSSTFNRLPTQLGGVPADAPQQPAAPAAYPAVHDMPPPRNDVTLTQEEQKRAEAELMALRERQEREAGIFPNAPPKPAPKPAPNSAPNPAPARNADQATDRKDQ